MTATVGDKGALPIVISFVTPNTDRDGRELTYPLTKAVLTRTEGYMGEPVVVKEWANPAMADTLSFTDETAQASVFYIYRASVSCEYGTSQEIQVNVQAGTGKPYNPTNLNAVLSDGGVTVSWNAPDKGENDSWIDVDSLRYDVYRIQGAQDILVAEDLMQTTFVDALDGVTSPTSLAWRVYAKNEMGRCEYPATTQSLVAGPAATLPFNETFGSPGSSGWGCQPDHAWTLTGRWPGWSVSTWSYIAVDGQQHEITGIDNTAEKQDGFLSLQFYSQDNDGDVFTSCELNLSEAEKPELTFSQFTNNADQADRAEITIEYTDNMSDTAVYKQLYKTTNYGAKIGWTECTVDLSELAHKPSVKIRLRALNPTVEMNTVAIDNLKFVDGAVNSLGSVAPEAEVVRVLYVDLNGREVCPAAGQLVIRVRIHADGTHSYDKLVY